MAHRLGQVKEPRGGEKTEIALATRYLKMIYSTLGVADFNSFELAE